MSDKDGNLSLKIGFEIDQAKLDKLVSDSVTKFSRAFGSAIHATVEGLDSTKLKIFQKGLTDHTGTSSSVINDISKDVKTILSILQSKAVTDIAPFTPIGSSIRTTPRPALSPTRGDIGVPAIIPYVEERTRNADVTSMMKQLRDKFLDVGTSTVKTMMKKGDVDVSKLKTIMPQFGQSDIEKYQHEQERKWLRDKGTRKIKEPRMMEFNEVTEQWEPLSFDEGHVVVDKPDTQTPTDIVKQLAQAGKALDILEFVDSIEGKELLNRLQYVRGGVTGGGDASLELVWDILTSEQDLLANAQSLKRNLQSSIEQGMKRDADVYEDIQNTVLRLLQSGASYSGEDYTDIMSVIFEPLKGGLSNALIVGKDIDKETRESVRGFNKLISRESLASDKKMASRVFGKRTGRSPEHAANLERKILMDKFGAFTSSGLEATETMGFKTKEYFNRRAIMERAREKTMKHKMHYADVGTDDAIFFEDERSKMWKEGRLPGGGTSFYASGLYREISPSKKKRKDNIFYDEKGFYDVDREIEYDGSGKGRMTHKLLGAASVGHLGRSEVSEQEGITRETSRKWYALFDKGLTDIYRRYRSKFQHSKDIEHLSKKERAIWDNPAAFTAVIGKALVGRSKREHAAGNSLMHLWPRQLKLLPGDRELIEVQPDDLPGTSLQDSMPFSLKSSFERDMKLGRAPGSHVERLLKQEMQIQSLLEKIDASVIASKDDEELWRERAIIEEKISKERRDASIAARRGTKESGKRKDDGSIDADDVGITKGMKTTAEEFALYLFHGGSVSDISEALVQKIQIDFGDKVEVIWNMISDIHDKLTQITYHGTDIAGLLQRG